MYLHPPSKLKIYNMTQISSLNDSFWFLWRYFSNKQKHNISLRVMSGTNLLVFMLHGLCCQWKQTKTLIRKGYKYFVFVYKNYIQFIMFTLFGAHAYVFWNISDTFFSLSNFISKDGKFKSYLKIRIKS